jgi:hypothetical protein
MPLFSWLLRRMTGRPHPCRTLARKPTTRFRPQLETLEGRDLPSFGTPVAYSAYATQALATADMNADGKPDLISLYEGNAVAVRLNNGNGTFEFAFTYPVHQENSDALAVSVRAGFPPQIVVATDPGDGGSFGGTDGISVLQFNSNGTFTETTYDNVFPTSAPITSLATADFFGNGSPTSVFPFRTLDVVAATYDGIVYVASLAYNFQAVQTYYVPFSGGLTHVAVGDFNGDGKPDIVGGVDGSGSDISSDSVSVLLNNGDGTFAAAQSYPLGRSPTAFAVGDFNRDGKVDIVTANADGTVLVLLNNGNGTFGTAQNYAISGPANSVAVGDFNHDGFLDVVTTGAEMDLLLNNGNGTFGAYQPVGPAGSNVVTDNFVSAGFFDLAQIDASQNSIDVLLNNADPTPAPAPVSLSFGSITYNRNKQLYSETVTLTNISSGPLTGPLSLELTNLRGDVRLTDATGTMYGIPYIRFLNSGKTLKKGASVTITLTFTAPSLSDIIFGTEVVAL